MTPEQRYLLDVNGYLLIPGAVEPDALAAARTALSPGGEVISHIFLQFFTRPAIAVYPPVSFAF
jgi:hypothetical protein